MKFPIELNTPEMELAKALAIELTIEGIQSGLAMPLAMHLMAIIDEGYDDPRKGIQKLKEDRRHTDEWWVKYHPKTKYAKAAKLRLEKSCTTI